MATIDGTDPIVFLGALAVLIGLGFVGNLIFSKLRFNDTLILILVGVIVGPITGTIAPDSLLAVSSIVGPLALILILFDGGLALKLHDLLHGLGSAAALGIIGFVLTTLVVGGLTSIALGVPPMTGLVLGAILGGTSALVVLPCLEFMKVEKKTGTTLGLESALTDVLVVIVSFTLISIAAADVSPITTPDVDIDMDGLDDAWETRFFSAPAPDGGQAPDPLRYNATDDPDGDGASNIDEFRGKTDPSDPADRPEPRGFQLDTQSIASKLLITFAMSIFMGVAAGLVWLVMYPHVRDKAYGYMLTLGFMFFLYVSVEWILGDVSDGGGPLAVLAFGVVLGNYEVLGKRMVESVGAGFGQGMKRFQGEISFLVRTFFFVYLGVLVDIELLKDLRVLGIGVLLMVGLLAARYVAVMATTRHLRLRGDDMVLWVMGPRGLAAAVLAAVPASRGIPGTEEFVALAFLILVFTNLFSTVGTMVLERRGNGPGPVAAVAGAGGAGGASASKAAKPRAKQGAKSSVKAPAKNVTKRFEVSGSTERSLEEFGEKKPRRG